MRPFTIRLIDRTQDQSQLQCVAITLDPGSKTTGVAVSRVSEDGQRHALALIELTHRGHAISEALAHRSAFRRRRRTANLRHREPRFDNRTKPAGWLAPSLQHRVDTTTSWVSRLRRLAPIASIAQEMVRFDMQKMLTPEISGVEYQQGTLLGYEVREYLLEKWDRTCAYCGKKDVPLEIEHIVPRSKSGSDRTSNLTLACHPCNQRKSSALIEVFLANDPVLLKEILAQAKAPLRDAAAVNSTRWALFNALKASALPVQAASGGRTKWNRTRFGLPKTHALDALCVGNVEGVSNWKIPALNIKATGRGAYQRTRLDAFGFPRGFLTNKKAHFGFQTGDLVRADVTSGKKAGVHVGRVAVRASGYFNIQRLKTVVQGISHKHCALIQHADGYAYA
jgi:5-methylcytosine-specific restriction endonuclease McrA